MRSQPHLIGVLRKHPRCCNAVSCTQRACEQRLPAAPRCSRPTQERSEDDDAHCQITRWDVAASCEFVSPVSINSRWAAAHM